MVLSVTRISWLRRSVVDDYLTVFAPDCLVVQCGGDALALDRLGGANLSVSGYQRALQLLLQQHLPVLLLGGGDRESCCFLGHVSLETVLR